MIPQQLKQTMDRQLSKTRISYYTIGGVDEIGIIPKIVEQKFFFTRSIMPFQPINNSTEKHTK